MKHLPSYALIGTLGFMLSGAIACGDDGGATGGSSGTGSPGGSAIGGSGGSAGTSTGGAPGPGWAGLTCTNPTRTDAKNCATANPNLPACTTVANSLCSAASQCQLQLLPTAKCADGHVRACSLGGQPGVLLCDTLPATKPRCDWKACVACGDPGQPCCLGGCRTGSCSALTGGTCKNP
jgi:hypothetical protein